MFFALDELESLQTECQLAYGENGSHDVKEFKKCRDLVTQWMQKAREEMVMLTQMRGVYTGPQTYSQTTGRPIRNGKNTLTDMADVSIKAAADSLEDARSLLAQMRADCWERLKVELDDL